MMTKNEIIESKIFTEDQLNTLIILCQRWYKVYMKLKEFKLDLKEIPQPKPIDIEDEIKIRTKEITSKELIYERLPYNVTAQFDTTGVYPDKIGFCAFLYNGGEHHIMKQFRIDAYAGEIVK